MATTLHDGEGNAVHTIPYGTMPDGDPCALCEGLVSDVLALLRKRRGLSMTLLCDGAPEMWNLLDEAFDAESFGDVVIHRLIDFWHAVEKLSAAANVLVAKKEEDAASMRARWKLALLNRSQARAAILQELIGSGREDVRVGESRPVHEAITYLTNNAVRMDYASARREQRPMGSGNVEATCKSLVGVRMKRPGARWKTDTGEHVLHLRALGLSDRWTEAMGITLRPTPPRIRSAARSACSGREPHPSYSYRGRYDVVGHPPNCAFARSVPRFVEPRGLAIGGYRSDQSRISRILLSLIGAGFCIRRNSRGVRCASLDIPPLPLGGGPLLLWLSVGERV